MELLLKNGLCVLIDSEDVDLVSSFKWFSAVGRNGKPYVVSTRKINGRQVRMHRVILGIDDPKKHIDHINGNPLDNRKTNLRICSIAENACNREKSKNSTSGYKGVSLCKSTMLYRAQIRKNRILYRLGRFVKAEDAAAAYDLAAKRLHGNFAKLNFGDARVPENL